jgi:protease II
VEKPYHIVDKNDTQNWARYLVKKGQALLPLVELVEQWLAGDELIDVLGRARIRGQTNPGRGAVDPRSSLATKATVQTRAEMAIGRYISEVRSRKFPGTEFTYPLKLEELEELKSSKYWKS